MAAGNRLRKSLKEGLIHSESEESYGEVDEKIVEEGWDVEDDAQSEVWDWYCVVILSPVAQRQSLSI